MSWLTRKCGEYFRGLLFFCAALSGIQVPAFVSQFETIAEQRWQEAGLALAPFKQDAQRYTQGDLEALIERYRSNSDAAIRDGGDNIHQLWQREQDLKQLVDGLSGGLVNDIRYVAVHPSQNLLDQTWKTYDFLIPLNQTAIVVGLVVGFLFIMLFDLLFACFRLPFRKQKTII
jgi:hypothetical protein